MEGDEAVETGDEDGAAPGGEPLQPLLPGGDNHERVRCQRSEWARPKLARRRSTREKPAWASQGSGGVSRLAESEVVILKPA